jgi:hydrogenase 3 maturation protease
MHLKDELQLFLGEGKERRIALIGIGNPMRGDDNAGLAVIDDLKKRIMMRDISLENVLLMKAGSTPENFTFEIRRFNPTHVLMIDAAQMNEKPGEARLLSPDNIGGVSISTHNLPLNILAEFIKRTTGAKIAVIGIQPEETEFGTKMSLEIKKAAKRISELIYELVIKINQ